MGANLPLQPPFLLIAITVGNSLLLSSVGTRFPAAAAHFSIGQFKGVMPSPMSCQTRRTMKRLVITALVATVLHTIACILLPPYEWGASRLECFYYAFRSGLIAFPILFAVLLFPLRAVLRRLMPRSKQRTHAIAAGVVLMLLIALMILPGQLAGVPVKPFQHSYLHKWIFWTVLVLAVVISFFWPFTTRNTSTAVS